MENNLSDKPKHAFLLHLDKNPSRYRLVINQKMIIDGNEENIQIKAIIKTKMTLLNKQQAYYDLILFPPAINNRKVGSYEKWDWIFARIFLINNGLRVLVGAKGDLQGVVNKEFILEKWKKTKSDILNLYDPQDVSFFLDTLDKELHSNFENIYYSDPFINLLFNDIYQQFIGDKIITPKIVGKHFGNILVFVNEKKQLKHLDNQKKTAIISFDSDWISDKLNIREVNYYLANTIPSSVGLELNYEFSRFGSYTMDYSKSPQVCDAEITIMGKMGDYYERTDHISLKKKKDGKKIRNRRSNAQMRVWDYPRTNQSDFPT